MSAACLPRPSSAPPALLDVLACELPASLIVQALGSADRKALRAAHSTLLAAVAREVTKLKVKAYGGATAALTPRRWPALRELALQGSAEPLRPSGTQVWERLEELVVEDDSFGCGEQEEDSSENDEDRVHALAAAAPRMPKLRVLRIENCWADSAASAVEQKAIAVPNCIILFILGLLGFQFLAFTMSLIRMKSKCVLFPICSVFILKAWKIRVICCLEL